MSTAILLKDAPKTRIEADRIRVWLESANSILEYHLARVVVDAWVCHEYIAELLTPGVCSSRYADHGNQSRTKLED